MAQSLRFLRRFCLGLAGCSLGLAAASAGAATQRAYAVLSLAGDSLNVVEHVAVTGSQIDHNNRQRIAVSDDTFEVAILRSVRDALQGAGEVALFSTRDPRLFTLQDHSLDADELPSELTSAVSELAAKSNVTHLILVTKHSSTVSIPMRDGYVGDGKFTGLGFYLDRDLRISNHDTGEISTGFIAPVASLDVTLIDTRAKRVVRHVHATRAVAYEANVSRSAAAPWDILTPAEKIRNLSAVTEAALHDAVPKVIAGD